MTTLLAFETATEVCDVAIWRDGEVCGRATRELVRGHAEALFPMIGEVLDATAIRYEDLDGLAVTVGPGSFTGIRIGLAAARGISLAAGIPACGITTTEAVAHGIPDAERAGHEILVVFDSKRRDPYYQRFDDQLRALDKPTAANPEKIVEVFSHRSEPVLLVGNGAEQLYRLFVTKGQKTKILASHQIPDACVLAALAAARWPDQFAAKPLVPVYIRPPDTTGPALKIDAKRGAPVA